ncbi:Mini-ribonuclease 3 [Clostridium sp. DL1XJH146]
MEFNKFKEKFNEKDAKFLNPLVLAYVGDTVFDLFIRTYLVDEKREFSVNKLHKIATSFVKASAQSEVMMKIMEELSEEELSIFKRARNCKSGSIPKNATVRDYKSATGFEALIGYLYLTEQQERLNYIMSLVIKDKEI